MPRIYLDTYAMVEYLRGNERYRELVSQGSSLVTSIMNLTELYYIVLRDTNESSADRAYMAFRSFQTPVLEEDVRAGMKRGLGAKARRVDFSYADAVGYAISERLGCAYLTGDSAFRQLPNVEFVR